MLSPVPLSPGFLPGTFATSNISMNITAAINSAAESLGDAGVVEARREAASLLDFVLGRGKVFLIAHPEYELTPDESSSYASSVARRAAREPFQYIVGKQEFYGLDFEVSPDVLIPRPETEILVEAAIEIASTLEHPRVLEVGVGSGCILVSILHSVPRADGVGIDISDPALAMARRNSARHNVSERAELIKGNVFDGAAGSFDLIVSNPPYIPDEQLDGLQVEVRFEPHTALFGGPQGTDIIEQIVFEAPKFLLPMGHLLIEIGFDQSERVSTLFDTPVWQSVELLPDLQGIPRIVRARLS